MKHNKRGAFFMLWVTILTLLLCTTAVVTYLSDEDELHLSLVSPLAVLEVRDELLLFEEKEIALIKRSLQELNISDFGSESFSAQLRGSVATALLQDETMKTFIFKDLYLDGKRMEDRSRAIAPSFVRNKLYGNKATELVGETLYFSRARIGKQIFLQSDGTERNTFPVEFYFEFDRSYAITIEGKGYKVSKAFL